MKIALIKTKLRTKIIIKKSTATANSNKNTEKPKPKKEQKGRNEK
jgi:hypothetical protein